jgi:hypothetical protein
VRVDVEAQAARSTRAAIAMPVNAILMSLSPRNSGRGPGLLGANVARLRTSDPIRHKTNTVEDHRLEQPAARYGVGSASSPSDWKLVDPKLGPASLPLNL